MHEEIIIHSFRKLIPRYISIIVAQILPKKKKNYTIKTKRSVFKGNQDYLVLYDSSGRMDEWYGRWRRDKPEEKIIPSECRRWNVSHTYVSAHACNSLRLLRNSQYAFRDPVSVLPPLVSLHCNLMIADHSIMLTGLDFNKISLLLLVGRVNCIKWRKRLRGRGLIYPSG